MKMLRPLISRIKELKARAQRSRPKSRRARPALEGLEVRCVPSTITELGSLPTLNSYPAGITTASDGSIWFTESRANKLGRLSPQGTLTEYPVPTSASDPEQITASPDGYVWFTERAGGKIGRVSAAGGPIAEFALGGYLKVPTAITTRSDGTVWFAGWEPCDCASIGTISSTGSITELGTEETETYINGLVGGPDGNLWATQSSYWASLNGVVKVSTAGFGSFKGYPFGDIISDEPQSITVGPDNALWFTDARASLIGQITTSGLSTVFALPAGSQPQQIVAGPDDAVWFTEAGTDKIGRMDMQGGRTEFALPTASSVPYGITRGPDGRLWFTEQNAGSIGYIRSDLSYPGLIPAVSSTPFGDTPAQIRHAYGFDHIILSNGVPGDGSGQIIGIVDAYDDPTIGGDLHAFDLQFGLPDPVLTKVNQSGGTQYPAADTGWAVEVSLDVEWAHAMAPGAQILLVEASSNSAGDLFTAVDYARNQPGVSVVSMSWSGPEFSGETSDDSLFTTPPGHQGVTFVASSGDAGTITYPAASPNVVAVGGTTLSIDGAGDYAGETAWSGSGGGTSAFETEPAYQRAVQNTGVRTSPDVAYDADPSNGFAIYDSYSFGAATPWDKLGGTSAGAPQWSGLLAIANQDRAVRGLGTIDGPSQTLPLLYSLPSADYHLPGYTTITGLGTPIANQVVGLSWSSLGGWVSAITALALPTGGQEVFAIGGDHAVWTRTQTTPGGSWSGWTSLGGWVSAITAGTNSNGSLEVFGVGSDHALWTITQTGPGGPFGGWTSLGGWVSAITMGTNSDGTLEVFAIGSDNAVYTRTQTTPGGSWGSWTSLGGWVSAIAAGTNSNGTVEVFAIGSDNAVYTRTQTTPGGSWSGWTSLGGWVSAITVGTNSNGTLEVFAIGSDHAVYTRTQTTPGGSWSGWTSLGGWVSAITVTTLPDGGLEVFAIGSDHAVWAIGETGPSGFFPSGYWRSFAGYVTAIAAAPHQYGSVEAFAIGSDNALWTFRRNGF
jgi:streptogramin lyase